ncbi:hypothetical protein ORV05_22490 [Amycolatopsis cynarae]|uniref:Uncharacterized protein n=1 Tax=Amycolatopsis cynarae TaxID=2995223 RepID=A0ABY7AUW6_9PSEU|nr:hypothetical protein [Amycolatopsis sp. HUAS 11-8]WAL63761.1 hypothetical protein ORV05_22490 [Amycolatopsis sp. HUAS 11-8]
MAINLTPTEILVGAGGLLVLVWMWRSGARRARRAADAARSSVRVVSLAGRVLLTTAGMVGAQWLIVTHTSDLTLRLVTLALPDMIAAYVLIRALTVTELGTTRRRGDRR